MLSLQEGIVDVANFGVIHFDTAWWLHVHLEDTPVLVHHVAWDLECHGVSEEGGQCRTPPLVGLHSSQKNPEHGVAMAVASAVVPLYPQCAAVRRRMSVWEISPCNDVVGIVALQRIQSTIRSPMHTERTWTQHEAVSTALIVWHTVACELWPNGAQGPSDTSPKRHRN